MTTPGGEDAIERLARELFAAAVPGVSSAPQPSIGIPVAAAPVEAGVGAAQLAAASVGAPLNTPSLVVPLAVPTPTHAPVASPSAPPSGGVTSPAIGMMPGSESMHGAVPGMFGDAIGPRFAMPSGASSPTDFYFLGAPHAPVMPPSVPKVESGLVDPAHLAVSPASATPPTSAVASATPTLTHASGPTWSDVRRAEAPARLDVARVRGDFPILSERINGRPLVWLDNAATTHKPRQVIDRVSYYYAHENSNVHRGAHTLAARSTDAYEGARDKVRRFLGASSTKEIVFVRGTTEAINLVAQSFGRSQIHRGDEIVLSTLEHHSNIVPWQLIAEERGARIRVIPVTDRGEVLISEYKKVLSARTRIVAITHVSNALGTVLPVAEMIQIAHLNGAKVLIDGAQAVAHMPVDVRALDADFYTISGHKLFAPTGIGALYGKAEVLEALPPWQGGGSMIDRVTFERSTYAPLPARLEAGTPALAQAVGLGAAVDYLSELGMASVQRHEEELLAHGTQLLLGVRGLRLIGTAPHKAAVLGFVIDGVDPVELGRCLDKEGIAVRAGHHCAQPSLAHFGLSSTVRPSLALYNTHGDLEHLAAVLRRMFGSA